MYSDAKPVGILPSTQNSNNNHVLVTLPTNSLNDENYPIGNGVVLMFYTYKNDMEKVSRENDKKSVETYFQSIGAKCSSFPNRTWKDMRFDIDKAFKGAKDISYVVCVVATHGDKKTRLLCEEGSYCKEELIAMFTRRPDLIGKPKIFFIQACRGTDIDKGHKIQFDNVHKIPEMADLFIASSSYDGYPSFRDENGSWFLQALIKVLTEREDNTDLYTVMTRVNRFIALIRMVPEENDNYKFAKQMPCFESTLLRKVYFPLPSN